MNRYASIPALFASAAIGTAFGMGLDAPEALGLSLVMIVLAWGTAVTFIAITQRQNARLVADLERVDAELIAYVDGVTAKQTDGVRRC